MSITATAHNTPDATITKAVQSQHATAHHRRCKCGHVALDHDTAGICALCPAHDPSPTAPVEALMEKVSR